MPNDISTEITNLQNDRTAIRSALAAKGVTATDHNFVDFATDIAAIPSGGQLPVNIAVDAFSVTETAGTHNLTHSLGATPNAFVIYAVSPSGQGYVNPFFIHGWDKSASASFSGYYRAFVNCLNANNVWDYSATGYGWKGTSSNLEFRINAVERLPVGNYVLVTYQFLSV